MTENTTTADIVASFFDKYRRALLDRDAKRVAQLYAVPALILFPGQSIAVSDAAQTEKFFASAWDQYEGVTDTRTELDVVATTPGSVWVDLTWHHDNGASERLMYQLVRTEEDWRIAVLTPLG
ncbi:nuclear transport factor 2 family protein [Microbacterium sp.]|uniref:nuclear transport factor 2 family protein n=1 Tax=Microbacterium sp. TaxID=51671 RepID=UPI002E2F16C7|nr:nuclear transport factor 2 family protein [Microbacterium sp.]HEX5728397.1 nuclear transport factor 2 family protein [Microbacterium sp.]